MVKVKGCGVKGCRFHAGDRCFSTKREARVFAGPMTEGQVSEIRNGPIKDILDAGYILTPGVSDIPDFYRLESRRYKTAQHSISEHIGWTPCWEDGRSLPGWRWWRVFETPSDVRQATMRVFRNEVEADMAELRAEFPGCDIDHNPLFEIGLLRFLNERNICLSSVRHHAPNAHKGDFASFLVDRDLAAEWVAYHLTEFELVPLPRAEHARADAARRKISKAERDQLRKENSSYA